MGLSDIKLTDIDFESVAACTQPRVLRKYIALLEEDGGYFHQLLHAARQKLASLTGQRGNSVRGVANTVSAAEIAAAREDLLAWQRSLQNSQELPCSSGRNEKTLDNHSNPINNGIEELEDPAFDGVEEASTTESHTDVEKVGGTNEAEPCPEKDQKEWCSGGREKERYHDAAGAKGSTVHRENSNRGGDTERRGAEEQEARAELNRGSNDIGEREAKETVLDPLTEAGCSVLEALHLREGKSLHLTSGAEVVTRSVTLCAEECALSLQNNEGGSELAIEQTRLSSSSSKLATKVKNYDRATETAATVQLENTEHGNRESHPDSKARQDGSSGSPLEPSKTRKLKICVSIEEEEGTDDSSDVLDSEEY